VKWEAGCLNVVLFILADFQQVRTKNGYLRKS
jgi:hypothetical protein